MNYCENSSRNFSGDFSRSTSRNFSRNHSTNSTGNSSRSSSRIFFWKYLKEYLRKDLWEFLCECFPDRGEFLKKFFQKLPGSAISAQYYSLFFRIKSNRTWYALANRCHRGRTHANPNKFANEANIWLLFALIVILLGRSPTNRTFQQAAPYPDASKWSRATRETTPELPEKWLSVWKSCLKFNFQLPNAVRSFARSLLSSSSSRPSRMLSSREAIGNGFPIVSSYAVGRYSQSFVPAPSDAAMPARVTLIGALFNDNGFNLVPPTHHRTAQGTRQVIRDRDTPVRGGT